jgi:hypothetical protein
MVSSVDQEWKAEAREYIGRCVGLILAFVRLRLSDGMSPAKDVLPVVHVDLNPPVSVSSR